MDGVSEAGMKMMPADLNMVAEPMARKAANISSLTKFLQVIRNEKVFQKFFFCSLPDVVQF